MTLFTFRPFFLFLCVGILASQPFKLSAFTSKHLALRWDDGLLPFVTNFRVLKAVYAVENLQSKMELAPAPSITFDPNHSNKRTVRKGPDPIHNRTWPASPLFLAIYLYKSQHKTIFFAFLTVSSKVRLFTAFSFYICSQFYLVSASQLKCSTNLWASFVSIRVEQS